MRGLRGGLAGLLLTGILAGTPVLAQGTGSKPPSAASVENKLIMLKMEGVDLYVAFKTLFQQAGVDYTLDPALKGNVVTVSLRQPFRIAIETLIKTSGLPITLSVENDVFSIVPKQEETPVGPSLEIEAAPEVPQNEMKITRIRPQFLDAFTLVALLGGHLIKWSDAFAPNTWGRNPFGFPMMGFAGTGPFGAGGNGAGGNGANTGQNGSGLLNGGSIGPNDIFANDADDSVLIRH